MDESTEEKKCKLCESVWVAFGIGLGLVFLYISVDLATGGRLTGLWSPRRQEEIEE